MLDLNDAMASALEADAVVTRTRATVNRPDALASLHLYLGGRSVAETV